MPGIRFILLWCNLTGSLNYNNQVGLMAIRNNQKPM